MKTQMRILLSGALVVVPLAITVSVVIGAGAWLDEKGQDLVSALVNINAAKGKEVKVELYHGTGVVLVLGLIYLAGLLTHVWGFRPLWTRFEQLLARVPGVKVIYESVRDLMKLFGGGAGTMGRVVEYRPPGSSLAFLGIVTNENPIVGQDDGQTKRVAVYLPLAYMFGGPTILAMPDQLKEVNIPVEEALKLAATAHVGGPGKTESAKGSEVQKRS
jgi:uncharacterized membrane protein